MDYRTFLLHLDGGERDDMRLYMAMKLVAFDQAHLIALRIIRRLVCPCSFSIHE
ncbi:MAG: hypothetical protein O3B21_06245 [Proteobacteria bacterium]|nr:hypothetical protein [Pseudomonadota bacterium]MDA1356790.1 hypothetical protein [Pseudomonadota bacterium]